VITQLSSDVEMKIKCLQDFN